jgi:glutamate 5-kinase
VQQAQPWRSQMDKIEQDTSTFLLSSMKRLSWIQTCNAKKQLHIYLNKKIITIVV